MASSAAALASSGSMPSANASSISSRTSSIRVLIPLTLLKKGYLSTVSDFSQITWGPGLFAGISR